MGDLVSSFGNSSGSGNVDIYTAVALCMEGIHKKDKQLAEEQMAKLQQDKKLNAMFKNAGDNIVVQSDGTAKVTPGSDLEKVVSAQATGGDPQAKSLLAAIKSGKLNADQVAAAKAVVQNAQTASGAEDDQIGLIKLQGMIDEITRCLDAMTAVVKKKGDTEQEIARNL